MGTEPTPRSLLRQLPLPAKLVITAFLIAVGLGYFSALVQLHMKHSNKDGEALPTVADVVERFSGLKQYDPNAAPPVSTIEQIIKGDRDADDVSKSNMAPAFFKKSKGYTKECEARGKTNIDFDREGELQAMILWSKSDPAVKKKAYEDDKFLLPDDRKGKPLTADFDCTGDKSGVKIKTLIEKRCMNCHDAQAPSLGKWAELEPLVTPPSTEVLPGNWVRTNKQITTESLTQSTHAHLLSFAVLFSLTGLVFAFTGYPFLVRCVIAPIVVIAQVCDIACWWLARLPESGPMFAKTIIMTGGIVGTGLVFHIVLGILDLYNWKGKAVVILLFLLGGAGVGIVGMKVVEPALKLEREEAEKAKAPKLPEEKPISKNGDTTKPPPAVKITELERLVMGPREGAKWNGKPDGSMAKAFYEKSEGWKDELAERGKEPLEAERKGEQLAVQAWARSEPALRKKTYEDGKFPLPDDLKGKPITPAYLAPDKTAVNVKKIFEDRCIRCHSKDGDQSDFPLETYDQLMKYLVAK